MPPRLPATVLVLASLLGSPRAVLAEVEIGGFAQVNYAARATGTSCASVTACDLPRGEQLLQLKLEAFSRDGMAAFASKIDLFHDAVLNEAGLEVRETYADLTSKYVTLRAGRQIITWGLGDLLFVNDVFPKDWVALFTGRPLQYLKIGSDALKVNVFAGLLDAEIVLAPFFQPDRYPTGLRLVLPDPFGEGTPRTVQDVRRSFENMELAGKLSRHIKDWELAVYASRGRFRTPAMAPDDPAAPTEVRLFFPRLNTFGASVSGGLLGGVLGVEGAYYDSQDDRRGTDPNVDNSQVKALVGYSYPLWEDATLGVQGYLEWMVGHGRYLDHLPPGRRARDERRWIATLRFTQLLLHQSLTFNVFAFWGISDQDAYLLPSVRYAFTDALWAEIGANIFIGRHDDTMFGMLDKNDNVYLTIRYGF